MQTTDRAGHNVLQEHYADLCNSDIDPVRTAMKLFQAKLINSAVKDECTVQGCRRDIQLITIIDAVMRQGKPGAFQEFTEIIATDCPNSWLADKLKGAYISRGGKWIEKEHPFATSPGNGHPVPDRSSSFSVSDPPLEESHLRREATYPRSHPRGHAPHPSFRAVCTLVAEETAGADHCLVSSDGGSTNLKAYKMMTSPHGIALVISNIKFDKPFIGQGLPNRTGGDVDEMNLQDLFGPDCLNYKVVLLKNLTGEQIETAFCLVSGHKGYTYDAVHEHDREALKALSDGGNLISKDHDSFVCCLLSHGNKGIVYGTDGKKFDLSSIYYYLGPCEHLAGKPKMAFIQACQGDRIAEHDGAQQPSVEDDGKSLQLTTKSSDFILSYAAFHGQKSFRWTEGKGTWYISALCKIFKENHKTMDVVSMITDVHNEVSNEKARSESGEDYLQCPRMENTLRYKVQLAMKRGAEQM